MTKIALAKRVSFTRKSILSCILQVSKTNVAYVQATRQVIPHGPLEPGERNKGARSKWCGGPGSRK